MTSTTRTASTVGPLAERRRNATSSRMTARVVGILLLAAMLTYGPGSGIVAAILDAPDYLSNVAASQMTFTLGAVLMFINSVAVAGIGVLLFPILKRHSEQVALAYYASRLVEAVLLIVGVISLLSLTAISGEYLGAGVADASRFETLGALAIQVNDLSYQIAMLLSVWAACSSATCCTRRGSSRGPCRCGASPATPSSSQEACWRSSVSAWVYSCLFRVGCSRCSSECG